MDTQEATQNTDTQGNIKNPQKTTSQKSIDSSTIIVLLIIIIFFLVGIIFYLIIKNNQEEQVPNQTNNISNHTKTSLASSTTTTSEEEYFEYSWYNDDYVKFMYPNNWNVEIYDDEKPLQYIDTTTKGIQSIEINDNDEYMLRVYLPAGFGLDNFEYDFSDPLVLSYTPEVGIENTIQLSSTPLSFTTEKYSITLLGILEPIVLTEGSEPKSVLLIGTKDGNTYTSNGNLVPSSFDFIVEGTAGLEDTSITYVEKTCPFSTEEDFDKCAEFIDKFFSTIETN